MSSARSPHMTSPLLLRPGAVEASGPDSGIAWHYGNPAVEQRALATDRAVVDQSHLGVVTVTGPDRLSWLHTLGSQSVENLTPRSSVEWMVLSPQGRIEHVAALVDDGVTTWLLTESAAGLAAHLERMRFMKRVEVADVSSEWAAIGETVALEGHDGGPVTWMDPWPELAAGGTTYVAAATTHPGGGRAWRLVLVPRERLAEEIDARLADGTVLAGTWASEAERIAAWRPRAATEVDDKTLPHELDWLRTAVHLDKGCYRGQETVAKVHNVGRPPRRLAFLHLDGAASILPAPGDEVLLAGESVGHVTSAARHFELGPIALAVIKRSAEPSAPLTVASESGVVAASQDVIVDPAGVSWDRPPPPGPTARGLLMGRGCAADGGDLPN